MIPLVALLVLLTLQASPGDIVSVNVTDTATLTVGDSCMYFVDNLQPSINATPGEYEVKIGINCTPGLKEVYADGSVLAQIDVNETTIDYQAYAASLEKENLALQKEVESLKEKLKISQEQIETLKSQLEDLQNKAKMLGIQNELQKQQIEELEKKLERAKTELQKKKSDLDELEEKIRELNRQSSIYRLATFFMVSLFVGSFVALVFVARKE
jgi:polyhydroxyalkanoate synthesis regulator phasin